MCVVSDCLLDKTTSCAKMAEPIELPFRTWTRVGPRNHTLGRGPHHPGEGATLLGDAAFRQNYLSTSSSRHQNTRNVTVKYSSKVFHVNRAYLASTAASLLRRWYRYVRKASHKTRLIVVMGLPTGDWCRYKHEPKYQVSNTVPDRQSYLKNAVAICNTIQHICMFNGPFFLRLSRKVKPIWILLKQDAVSGSGSGIS